MKKIILPLLLTFLLLVTQVSALTMFVNWPDGGTDDRVVYRGNDVAFNYESFDFHESVDTVVALYRSNNLDTPLMTFVDETAFGETSGYITFQTDDLSITDYTIRGEATTIAGTFIDQINFELVNPVVENTAPYFLSIPDYFEYYLSDENDILFNVANYAYDDENDLLSYSLDQTNTDSDVVVCNMYFQSSIYCEFIGPGITTVDVIVSDGELSTSHTVTIRVIDDAPVNTAPYFFDLPSPFSYPISMDNVDVLQLSDYAYDDENDALTFGVEGGDGIVSCSITSGDILYCDILAIGSTDLTVTVSDGEYTDTETITINIYDDADPNTAPFFNELPLFYEYYVSQGSADLVDLADYAYDAENDDLTFSIDESIPGVTCYLTQTSVVHCDFNTVITDTFTVSVSDGEFSDTVTITLSIIEDPITNTAPYWNGLAFNYEYNIELGHATLAHLSEYAYDNEGDSLSFVLDESSTDGSIIDCFIDSDNYLICFFEGDLGTTNLDVVVSDGELSTIQTLSVTIYEDVNNPPEWSDDLTLEFTYNIDESPVTVIDVMDYVTDIDGDTITVTLDESDTDFDVVNCFLSMGTNLVCLLQGVGTTTIDLIASDADFDVPITIVINVYEDEVNVPPVWSNDLDLYYSYHIDESPVTVIDVMNYVSDANGDSIDITLDESQTNFDVLNCFLSNGDLLVCLLEGVGTTTVDLIASDGEYNVGITLVIEVYDDGNENTAPYFIDLPNYFEYPLSQGDAYLVDLADYAYDAQNDPLSYSVNENINGVNCQILGSSLLYCSFTQEVTGTFTVSVGDGEFSDTESMVIHIYDDTQTNLPPVWSNDLELYYSYNIDESPVTVIDLDNFASDPNDDTITFSLDESNTDFDVFNCFISNGNLFVCLLEGVGTSTVEVTASDGEFDVPVTLIINVYDDVVENTAPYWTVNMPTYFEYELDLENVDVLNLANYVGDAENDQLTFSLDQSQTNFDVLDCSLQSFSTLNCDLNNIGLTTLDVVVSDGEFSVSQTIVIKVINTVEENHPPQWSDNLELYYSYHIDESPVTVIDLDNFAYDIDGDSLSFSIDESNTDFDVFNCFISNNNLFVCLLEGVGTSTVDVTVSDGEFDVPVTLIINVYDTNDNEAPYWDANIPSYFEYELDLENVNVFNIANYVTDSNGDVLTYSLDQSQTDFNVLDCTLQSFSTLNCDLNNVGLTSVNILVSDGEYTISHTVIIKVINTVEENHPPVWSNDLELYYSYHIDESPATVIAVRDFVSDIDGDTIDITLDESNTDFDVVNCFLSNNDLLVCLLEGEGTTSISLIASDGEYDVPITITINVYDTNEAPMWDVNMPTHFSYPISDQVVTVIQLNDYATDADGDDLSYFIDESNTDFGVIDCFLNTNTDLICVLNGIGTATLDVVVSDGEISVDNTLVIEVYDDNHAPFFDDNMPLYFEYDIDLENVDVINLAQYAYDPDADQLFYTINTSGTNNNIVTCDLFTSTLNCDLNNLGQTTLDVTVSDGLLSQTVTITIKVIQDNTAPYFSGLDLYYSYNIDLEDVDVVQLSSVAFDAQNDDLTFSLDQSNTNNNVVSCNILADSTLHCNLNGVGTTTLDVLVSDGEFSESATITINVFEVNEPPMFSANIPTYFEYPVSQEDATLMQVSNYVSDPNEDILTYSLDTTNMDENVVNCAINAASIISCDINGVGTTTFDVLVSDGEFTISQSVTVHIYNDNTAPYWGVNMPTYFEYGLSLEEADLLQVSTYAFDNENDDLTFDLDTSNTDANVATCYMLQDSTVKCIFESEGITTMDVIVSDGEFSVTQTLTLNIIDDIVPVGPTAIISTQGNRNTVGTAYLFNGYSSYTAPGEYIVSYHWVIKNPDGLAIAMFDGPAHSYTFNDQNEYTIELSVVDSQGLMDTAVYMMQSRWGEAPKKFTGLEEGLFINSLEIHGTGFEQAEVNGEIMIVATVTNYADDDLKDVRMTFTIPELGWKIKSNAIDLDEGERENIQILDYLPDYIEEGVYYPIVSFSDTEIRRSKPMYLEVTA